MLIIYILPINFYVHRHTRSHMYVSSFEKNIILCYYHINNTKSQLKITIIEIIKSTITPSVTSRRHILSCKTTEYFYHHSFIIHFRSIFKEIAFLTHSPSRRVLFTLYSRCAAKTKALKNNITCIDPDVGIKSG